AAGIDLDALQAVIGLDQVDTSVPRPDDLARPHDKPLDLRPHRTRYRHRAPRRIRDPVLRRAIRRRDDLPADNVGANIPSRFLDVLLDIEDFVMEGAMLGLLLDDRPGLVRTVHLRDEATPGTRD